MTAVCLQFGSPCVSRTWVIRPPGDDLNAAICIFMMVVITELILQERIRKCRFSIGLQSH